MELSVVERLKIAYNAKKGVSTFSLLFSILSFPMPRSRPALPCPVRCANIHTSIGPVSGQNRNLPSFSVGAVRARSVFSVESAEFCSVANNDVTF